MSPRIHSPTPQRCLKRKVSELDQTSTSSDNKRQKAEPILDWLCDVHLLDHRLSQTRPSSAPASFSSSTTDSAIPDMPKRPLNPPTPIDRLPTPAATSVISAASTKAKTDDPTYHKTLYQNGIAMDRSGRRMDPEIKEFVKKHIAKERTSPVLTQKELDEVMDLADTAANRCEDTVRKILDTKMFPIHAAGIDSAGNIPFTAEPLPRGDAFHELAVPKPDQFYGYTDTFTRRQQCTMSNPIMVRYAQPTSDSDVAFPFLLVEVKSEAKGGTMWHGENQAAGSGSHCVSSLRWLLQNAAAGDAGLPAATHIGPTDAVAFSVCLNAGLARLFVHSYSEVQQEYVMSRIGQFSTTDESDIQRCRRYIKNIVEYAKDIRLKSINTALNDLDPLPLWWPHKKAK